MLLCPPTAERGSSSMASFSRVLSSDSAAATASVATQPPLPRSKLHRRPRKLRQSRRVQGPFAGLTAIISPSPVSPISFSAGGALSSAAPSLARPVSLHSPGSPRLEAVTLDRTLSLPTPRLDCLLRRLGRDQALAPADQVGGAILYQCFADSEVILRPMLAREKRTVLHSVSSTAVCPTDACDFRGLASLVVCEMGLSAPTGKRLILAQTPNKSYAREGQEARVNRWLPDGPRSKSRHIRVTPAGKITLAWKYCG
jgi:hypothetical protein